MKTLRIILVFFKGLLLLLWLIFSLGFGMWGYCEIVGMSRLKKVDIAERNPDNRDFQPAQQLGMVDEAGKPISEDFSTNLTYEYNDVTFASRAELLEYLYLENQKNSFFGQILQKIKIAEDGNVSTSVIFIFTAISFGVIGTITQQIKYIIVKRSEFVKNQTKNQSYILEDVSVLFRPVFGGLVGFMAYGITLLIPTIIQNVSESTFIRPTTLLFFCFFSGMMSDEIYDWVANLIIKLFEGEGMQMEKI